MLSPCLPCCFSCPAVLRHSLHHPSLSCPSFPAGFPRIGAKREIKTALEAYWSGKLTQPELLSIAADVQAADWELQAAAGITRIGIDGTLYDQVLDTTFALGLAPVRFSNFSGLELYFAMARGASGVGALDMSKFFDTNYHYLVSGGAVCGAQTIGGVAQKGMSGCA
jgi:hypothetical protein